jgi:hypothetical protein
LFLVSGDFCLFFIFFFFLFSLPSLIFLFFLTYAMHQIIIFFKMHIHVLSISICFYDKGITSESAWLDRNIPNSFLRKQNTFHSTWSLGSGEDNWKNQGSDLPETSMPWKNEGGKGIEENWEKACMAKSSDSQSAYHQVSLVYFLSS